MPTGCYKRLSGNELKHRIAQLKAWQREDIEHQIARSVKIILDKAGAMSVVMFSGGRDSTTLAVLVKIAGIKARMLYNDTGLGLPAERKRVVSIAKSLGLQLSITTGDVPEEVWQQRGHWPLFAKRGHTYWKRAFPGLRCSPMQCCYWLKEKPARIALKNLNADVTFWGNKAGDSYRRRMGFADHMFGTESSVKYSWSQIYPIQTWTDTHVADFLKAQMPNFKWSGYESGCRQCGTDITRKDGNLSRLLLEDPAAFKKYMRSGAGEMIALVKGYDPARLEEIIETRPELLAYVSPMTMKKRGNV